MIDASASIEEIRVSVKERMANLGDSLAGTSIVIDTGGQELAAPDLEHLKSLIFETYGLEIVTDPESPAPTPDTQEDKQQKAKKEVFLAFGREIDDLRYDPSEDVASDN